jgi:hypothetical protein
MFKLLFHLWLVPRLLPGCLFWLLLIGLVLAYCGEQKATEHRPANAQNQGRFHSREINKRNLKEVTAWNGGKPKHAGCCIENRWFVPFEVACR